MIEQKYDPQDRPIYPAGSYWEQANEFLDSHLNYKAGFWAMMMLAIGSCMMWMLLGWVY